MLAANWNTNGAQIGSGGELGGKLFAGNFAKREHHSNQEWPWRAGWKAGEHQVRGFETGYFASTWF